jgi:hypothetical protein
MLHAVSAPVLKLVAVGALGTAAIVGFGPTKCEKSGPVIQRLSLHAPVLPNAIYLTAFHDGDVTVKLDSDGPHKITFRMRATLDDTCKWEATEILIPRDDKTYDYSYDEIMLGCDPGAEPRYVATPRVGTVTVED